MNGVAELLRRAVGLASRTQHLESQTAFVQCLLRDATCSIQLCLYAVPESHCALAVGML
jgi:hypothetical protein